MIRKVNVIFICLLCSLINISIAKAENSNNSLLIEVLEPHIKDGLDLVTKKIWDWLKNNETQPLNPKKSETINYYLEELPPSIYGSSVLLTSYQKAVKLYREKSYKEALALFEDLSRYSEASFMLGLMYCNGNAVSKHSYSANNYFKKANSLCICTDHNVLRCD